MNSLDTAFAKCAVCTIEADTPCKQKSAPYHTPEDGITCYAHDRTQDPACSIA